MALVYLGRKGRTVTVPPGRLPDVQVEHPERTTAREAGFGAFADVELREWPSTGAAREAIRMARSGTNPRNLRMLRREDR